MRSLFTAVLASALLAGCATESGITTTSTTASAVLMDASDSHRPAPPGVAPAEIDALSFVGDGAYAYVDGVTGKALTIDEVLVRMRARRVVVVGEQHDERKHHELQRRIIEMLGAEGPDLAVGFEMFTWDKQPALDRFASGEGTTTTLAEEVQWKKTWGFDIGLYAPLFDAARDAGARLVALNAPRTLVRAVRQKGVDGLDAEERAMLPELDLGDERHRRWFESIFQGAGHPLKADEVAGFYRAQVLWDESMAERTVKALEAGARQVVVIAGAGHVASGRGIPQRVERRLKERVLTIVPLVVEEDPDAAQRALAEAIADADADILVVPWVEQAIVL